MAVQLDSSAVFLARVKQVGLEPLWNSMSAKGWESWGDFSTASSWIPGTPDDADFRTSVIEVLLGPVPPPITAADDVYKYEAKRQSSKGFLSRLTQYLQQTSNGGCLALTTMTVQRILPRKKGQPG